MGKSGWIYGFRFRFSQENQSIDSDLNCQGIPHFVRYPLLAARTNAVSVKA